MSGPAAPEGAGEAHLGVQFENREQQDESYTIGMWAFLVTEIMFFGALFLAYVIYRTSYPVEFREAAHRYLNVPLGTLNTGILLTSSLTMALAVRAAHFGRRRAQMALLAATCACAVAFLGIKAVEWRAEFAEQHLPGATFSYEGRTPVSPTGIVDTTPADPSGKLRGDTPQLFFVLYFIMTGLHAIHVIIGIGIMLAFIALLARRHDTVAYHMPLEMTGLYWHFVDVVWVFLFPLFYLIPR